MGSVEQQSLNLTKQCGDSSESLVAVMHQTQNVLFEQVLTAMGGSRSHTEKRRTSCVAAAKSAMDVREFDSQYLHSPSHSLGSDSQGNTSTCVHTLVQWSITEQRRENKKTDFLSLFSPFTPVSISPLAVSLKGLRNVLSLGSLSVETSHNSNFIIMA